MKTNSPQKRRQLVLSGLPPSPLTRKRQDQRHPLPPNRVNPVPKECSFTKLHPASEGELLYTMEKDSITGEVPDLPTIPASTLSTSVSALVSQANPMASIVQETHFNRLTQRDAMMNDTGTQTAYGRHLANYQQWWAQDQDQRIQDHRQSHPPQPAHPITATKVALFLQYESTREIKAGRNQKSVPNSRLGPSSIRQCISALESERFHLQHREDYAACDESQKPLRDDNRIKAFEDAADATEAERVIQMQFNKAKGIQSDTFTEDELVKASMYLLEKPEAKTAAKVHNSICTRAMLLISTSMAFRGDNIRKVLLSDVFIRDIPLPDVSLEFKLPALVVYSKQGKENKTGRTDEQGAFRHRRPELCAVGALAFYLYSLFHILGSAPPSFEPDYSNMEVEEIGFRSWYEIFLFTTGKDTNTSITYENQRKRLNRVKEATGLSFKKVTHSGRHFAVEQAAKYNAPVESRRALGGWNVQGSMRPCYDRALPADAMLATAGFSASKHSTYCIGRDVLDPPDELLKALFPWVEEEHRRLLARIEQHGNKGHDNALKNLLELLVFFRRILLQDAAVLYSTYPLCPLFAFPPFNTPAFRHFSLSSSAVIAHAEEDARARLAQLPEDVAATFRGLMTNQAIHQAQSRQADSEVKRDIQQSLQLLTELTRASTLRGSTGKKRKALEAVLDSIGGARSSPMPPRSRRSSLLPPVAASMAPFQGEPPFSDDSPPSLTPPGPSLPLTSEATQPTLPPRPYTSPLGGLYAPPNFPFSTDPKTRVAQELAINELEKVFPYEKIVRHRYDWEDKPSSWLPTFTAFWKPARATDSATIDDFWLENRIGKDGMFSIQELDVQWGARWKRNRGALKTEYTRRGKVVALIEKLSSKANWNSAMALRFLHDSYPHESRTGRIFSDFLNAQHIAAILEASNHYTSIKPQL